MSTLARLERLELLVASTCAARFARTALRHRPPADELLVARDLHVVERLAVETAARRA